MSRAWDHHLPQFHIRLPRGFVNDPNGPLDLDGEVHLYFQSRSKADLSVPVEWGHATSDDLVHWRLHRPAMAPAPGGLDSDGCYSGNTVVVDGQVRAYYSGNIDGKVYQSVLMAVSEDGGASFGTPVQVVDDPGVDEGVTMFRDPFVWDDGHGWAMAVGAAGPDETASIRYYRSADGVQWRHLGDLAALGRTEVDGSDTGAGWECPQILTVDGADVAVVSSWSQADGPANVLAFALDGRRRLHRVDDGHNFYAASVMRDSTWGPILFGWITEERDPVWWKDEGWAGAISLPRRPWLADGRIATEPHPVVESLRDGPSRPAAGATIGAQAEVVVPVATTGCVRLRFADDEYCDVELDAAAGTVAVDRTAASADARADGGRAAVRDAFGADGARPAVRVFIDGSVIEVFTSGGRSLTSRVYPTAPPPWTVEASTDALVWDLECTITP